jgi:cell division protein FtsI (penicillin-binding protein 3)
LEKKTYLDIYEGENPGFHPENLVAIRQMLESVTQSGGTGYRASVAGYRVAGKTGTVEKLGENGYQKDKHLALFCGVAPASDPRLVMVVIIDTPNGKEYFGGSVAAPVFAKVMSGALRMLNVAPDAIDIPDNKSRVALLDN